MLKHIAAPHKALSVVAIAALLATAPQPLTASTAVNLANVTSGTYFRPPSNPRLGSGYRTSTGTRYGACLGGTETAFTLFGPDDSELIAGLTTSSHPTFAWHLPETEATVPVIFRLLAPDEDNIPVPVYQTKLDYDAGLMSHQLPDTVEALTTDTEYRWQVIVECNPEFPAQAIIQERSFEVVPTSATLAQALSSATTASDRAVAYGQAGVWYDAIAQVAQARTATDSETRMGLLTDLAASLPEEKEQLRQDILDIIAVTER
ncbi:MAG: DUF928 domain-containing protein [Cyanobacteria bacterium P01_C01_bin.118]